MELRVSDIGNVEFREEKQYGPDGKLLSDNTESFTFDNLNRLTGAATVSRPQNGPQINRSESYTYAANGNILSKSGTGTYKYESLRPHAVTSVEGKLGGHRKYTYDSRGRMTYEVQGADNKTLRSIAYTSFDQPWAIQHFASRPLEHDLTGEFSGTTTIHHGFGTGLSRLVELRRKGNFQERTVFLGAVTIRQKIVGNEVRLTERRSSLGGAAWVERTHGGGLVQRGY